MTDQASSGISNVETLIEKMFKFNETMDKCKTIMKSKKIQYFEQEQSNVMQKQQVTPAPVIMTPNDVNNKQFHIPLSQEPIATPQPYVASNTEESSE